MSNSKRAQMEQRQKQQLQRIQNEKKAYKDKVKPLVDFLKKNGLQFKHATVMGQRIEYFRANQFQAILQEKKQQIARSKQLPQLVKLYPNDFFFFKRPQNTKNLKYPTVLQPTNTTNKFVSFRFDTTESTSWKFVLLILAILCIVLFPVWPFAVKYAVWLISLYLLIFLVGLILLRLAIFLLFSSFGISIWIFPNLFSEYGFIDSFRPFIQVEKWQRKWYNYLFQILVIAVIGYYGYLAYEDHTFILQNVEGARKAVNDIHDWGVGKIKGQKNFSQSALGNKDLESILNETADVAQNGSEQPQQTSFEGDDYQNDEAQKQNL